MADGNPQIQMLARCCNVWIKGIYWENDEDKVIVEVTEHYRIVTVVISMNDVIESRNIFNNVITTILKLSEMHSFKCEEYLIAPSDVAKARSLVKKCTLYHISDVAQSVLAKCNVSDANNAKEIGIEQIVGVDDPFFCIAPSVTKALFSAKLPLRDDHLKHILNRCSCFSFILLFSSQKPVKERCNLLTIMHHISTTLILYCIMLTPLCTVSLFILL